MSGAPLSYTELIGFLGFLISFVVLVFGGSKHVTVSCQAIRAELLPKIEANRTISDQLEQRLNTKLDSLCNQLVTKIETVQKGGDVQVQSLRNEANLQIQNVQEIEGRARHAQNQASTIQLAKLEGAIKDMARKEDFTRLERSMERIEEKVAKAALTEQTVTTLVEKIAKLEPLLVRLEARGANL